MGRQSAVRINVGGTQVAGAILNALGMSNEPPSNWKQSCTDGCSDPGILGCCEAAFLSCCTLGYLAAQVSPARFHNFDCGTCCAAGMLTYFLGGCGVSIMSMSIRNTARARFNIQNQNDDCTECLIGCCCPVCSMTQIEAELKHRGLLGGTLCLSADNVDKRTGNIAQQPVVMQMGMGMGMQPQNQGFMPVHQQGAPMVMTYPGAQPMQPAVQPGYQPQYYGQQQQQPVGYGQPPGFGMQPQGYGYGQPQPQPGYAPNQLPPPSFAPA